MPKQFSQHSPATSADRMSRYNDIARNNPLSLFAYVNGVFFAAI